MEDPKQLAIWEGRGYPPSIVTGVLLNGKSDYLYLG